jgi:HNH endonuclease
MSHPAPTPAAQILFLRSFQRLLDEGSFTASYKFALLHSIADLCVLQNEHDGGAVELDTLLIAEQFIRLYWPQVIPFVAGMEQEVLRQNTGREAAVVRELKEQHARYQGSLVAVRNDSSEWSRLIRAVRRSVEQMPLWRLQTVGSDRLEFLYRNQGSGHSIELQPGVAYCFRAFYPMLTDMIEGAWSQFVQKRNPRLMGQVTDLRSFLFGSRRASLQAPQNLLREVQGNRCFYCDGSIQTNHAVDHFIPWRRYPLDLGHNYVLAHARCNSSKSDLLAAEQHLDKWVGRNQRLGEDLNEGFERFGVVHDLTATLQVATWAYGQVHAAQGQVWVEGQTREGLSDGWERMLALSV